MLCHPALPDLKELSLMKNANSTANECCNLSSIRNGPVLFALKVSSSSVPDDYCGTEEPGSVAAGKALQ